MIMRGVCTANDDPEGLLRIKVRIPAIHGELGESEWAWPCVPPNWWGSNFVSGSDPDGTVSSSPTKKVPAPQDGVWVMFENDDMSKPVWLGVWKKA